MKTEEKGKKKELNLFLSLVQSMEGKGRKINVSIKFSFLPKCFKFGRKRNTGKIMRFSSHHVFSFLMKSSRYFEQSVRPKSFNFFFFSSNFTLSNKRQSFNFFFFQPISPCQTKGKKIVGLDFVFIATTVTFLFISSCLFLLRNYHYPKPIKSPRYPNSIRRST